MGQAGGIRFQVFQGCLRIRAETGLIAHRPEDNGGTVLVAVIEQAYPVHQASLKSDDWLSYHTWHHLHYRVTAVGLQILRHRHEIRSDRKAAGNKADLDNGQSDGIYVMLLHNLKVPDNGVISTAGLNRIAVVAVYSGF